MVTKVFLVLFLAMFKVEPAPHELLDIDERGWVRPRLVKHLLCQEHGPGFRSSAARKSSEASAENTSTG